MIFYAGNSFRSFATNFSRDSTRISSRYFFISSFEKFSWSQELLQEFLWEYLHEFLRELLMFPLGIPLEDLLKLLRYFILILFRSFIESSSKSSSENPCRSSTGNTSINSSENFPEFASRTLPNFSSKMFLDSISFSDIFCRNSFVIYSRSFFVNSSRRCCGRLFKYSFKKSFRSNLTLFKSYPNDLPEILP